jgi:DNA uptake protein ComE-like DNA-binding protein
MKHGLLKPILVTMVLLLGAGTARGQEAKKKPVPPVAPTANKTDVNPLIAAQSKARSKALKAEKKKVIPESQRVDINGATREELMKLPGVTDPIAAKIIAGRPYRTKIHLVTHDVLSYALYTSLKGRIIARQKGVK